MVWLLQRRLLIQLHTYVCLLVPPSEEDPGSWDEEPPLATRVGGRSLSTPSALSFGSPSKCWRAGGCPALSVTALMLSDIMRRWKVKGQGASPPPLPPQLAATT